MVDGLGAPDGPTFGAAVGRLYGALAAFGGTPSVPFEGLWSSGDSVRFDLSSPPAAWRWTLMLELPVGVPDGPPVEAALRVEAWAEGRAVELLHVGPYAEEPRTVARLDAYREAHGLEAPGRHHEIYLDDPRTTRDGNCAR